nr:hypothetical protein [uncultured Desulfobacter sp.]
MYEARRPAVSGLSYLLIYLTICHNIISHISELTIQYNSHGLTRHISCRTQPATENEAKINPRVIVSHPVVRRDAILISTYGHNKSGNESMLVN